MFTRHTIKFYCLIAMAVLFAVPIFVPNIARAQSGNPPSIDNVKVTDVTATSAIVQWTTDQDADEEVNYCLTPDYGIVRNPTASKREHSLRLENMDPSTIYHLRVTSANSSGDRAFSGDYTVPTKGVVQVKSAQKLVPEERTVVEKIVQQIQKLETQQAIQSVQQELDKVTKKKTDPPVIQGRPKVEEIGFDYVIIGWNTDEDAASTIEFSPSDRYADGSYELQSAEDAGGKDHHIRVDGLASGREYHFRAASKSSAGLTGYSPDDTFTTKATLPKVQSLRIIKAEADSVTIGWKTDVPAAGVVEYADIKKPKDIRTVGTAQMLSTQTVRIAGLTLGTRYRAVVKAENSNGEKSESDPFFFQTVKDTTPPLVSKMSNESTLYPTADAKVQTIVSWETDEPAYCSFVYREGVNPNVKARVLDEDKEPRTKHVQVIVEFSPSTVYQYWVTCRDIAHNSMESEKFVLFTPNKEKSIIDIIMENFQGAFGWMKNVGK